jgi:membrane associated rhomboid family serine protease
MNSSFGARPSTPPTVRNLIILTVVCHILSIAATVFLQFNVVQNFGLHNWNSAYFKPWQLVSYMFLHDMSYIFLRDIGGITHLLFNMLGLWMFGSMLERFWGAQKFIIFYFVTGIGAGLINVFSTTILLQPMFDSAVFYMNNPGYNLFEHFVSNYLPGSYDNEGVNEFLKVWFNDPLNPGYIKESVQIVNQVTDLRLNTPTVGASGSIYGLLLAFGVLFPNSVIMLLIPPIPLKAKYFVLIFGGMELLLGLRNNLEDNVGHFAHLGGMLFGILLILLWKKQAKNKNVI